MNTVIFLLKTRFQNPGFSTNRLNVNTASTILYSRSRPWNSFPVIPRLDCSQLAGQRLKLSNKNQVSLIVYVTSLIVSIVAGWLVFLFMDHPLPHRNSISRLTCVPFHEPPSPHRNSIFRLPFVLSYVPYIWPFYLFLYQPLQHLNSSYELTWFLLWNTPYIWLVFLFMDHPLHLTCAPFHGSPPTT